MDNTLAEFRKTFPNLADNIEDIDKFKNFYKLIDNGLTGVDKRLKKNSYSDEDKFLFSVYAQYFVELEQEYKQFRSEGKFNNLELNLDYLNLFKKFYKIQGNILEFSAKDCVEEYKCPFLWGSNVNYAKSAYIAQIQGDILHNSKQMGSMTKNWIKCYELKQDEKYLYNAKKSFLKLLLNSESINNKSINQDIKTILSSSKELEILLLIDKCICYT